MNSIEQAHIIKGRVQKADYRDYIDEMAFNLDLKGYVKNIPESSVEVVCEGKREKIERFIDKIRIKQYLISVEKIEVDYSDARAEFVDFEIIREEDLTEAVYERMDTAARYMREMNRDLGEKVDSVGKDTGEIRRSLHTLEDHMLKYEELRRDKAGVEGEGDCLEGAVF